MTGWVILVDQPKDFANADTPHKVIMTSEYLARPKLFDFGRPKLVNLARSYAYQSKGYYASLLAEARGHRIVPTDETMLELREAKLYEHALPELEDELNRCARKADFQPEAQLRLLVCFGIASDPRFEAFGRLLFDWFRCPALEITVDPGIWLSIDRIRPRTITRLANGDATFFRDALHQHTKREWRDPKARSLSKYDLAVLHDPNEKLPPSSVDSLKHFARIAEKLSVDVEPITRRQLDELAEYDGLFIRETTSIDNHTYRFARRAWQEGMPVIDDPMHQQGVPDGAARLEPGADAADPDARRELRSDQGHGRAGSAAGRQNSRRLVLARGAQGQFARGVQARHPGAVRGNRPAAGAEIPADRVQLARRRAQRRAAVRVPIPDGARPLADRQAPRRRLLARGRVPHLRARPGAQGAGRRRRPRRQADRRGILRGRHQADRPRLRGHGGQRQSQPRARHRGRGRQGRDLDAAAQMVHRTLRAVSAPRPPVRDLRRSAEALRLVRGTPHRGPCFSRAGSNRSTSPR